MSMRQLAIRLETESEKKIMIIMIGTGAVELPRRLPRLTRGVADGIENVSEVGCDSALALPDCHPSVVSYNMNR